MKILLRNYKDKYYVWKTAEYKNGEYCIRTDDDHELRINQTDILAVTEDDRNSFVTCAHCGEVIKNDAASIEAHFAEREAKRNCFECEHMSTYGQEKKREVKYTKNADGTYHIETSCDSMVGCGFNSWKYSNIDEESTKRNCQYHQCRAKGVQSIEDVFTKYPGLFNKSITIDTLQKKGLNNRRPNGIASWAIDLGLRGNTLYAVVNELGIVDRFIVRHRYSQYDAFYSDKYDKMFFVSGGKYTEELPGEMSQAKCNSAKRIIKALYKEV